MLVTGVVVTPIAGWSDSLSLAVSLPHGCVSHGRGVRTAVRSSTGSNRALGGMHDHEGKNGPEGEATAQRPQTDDPPLTPHGATLSRAKGHRARADLWSTISLDGDHQDAHTATASTERGG